MPPRARTNGWRRRWERCRQPPIQFETASDIPKGGVPLALPALPATGLLRHTEAFYALPNGFYGIASIFPLLALMALARIKSLEQLRYVAPGEWGKHLKLERHHLRRVTTAVYTRTCIQVATLFPPPMRCAFWRTAPMRSGRRLPR